MPIVRPSLEQQLSETIIQSIEVNVDVNWLLGWVRDNFDADYIYSDEHLAAWAERAGYVSGPKRTKKSSE